MICNDCAVHKSVMDLLREMKFADCVVCCSNWQLAASASTSASAATSTWAVTKTATGEGEASSVGVDAAAGSWSCEWRCVWVA